MKHLRGLKSIGILLLLTVLFTGCRQKENTEAPTVEKEFDLATLPDDWVMLTPKDGGYIIYNTCDSGNLLLTIDRAAATLLLHGTQEDYEFDILKSYIGENDTIVVNAKWKGAEQLQDFKFIWEDKAKNIGRWITTYDTGYDSNCVFVPANLQSQFPVVNQPCRECWGDECDEREAQEADSLNADSLNIDSQ
jgi:hypothetical protein